MWEFEGDRACNRLLAEAGSLCQTGRRRAGARSHASVVLHTLRSSMHQQPELIRTHHLRRNQQHRRFLKCLNSTILLCHKRAFAVLLVLKATGFQHLPSYLKTMVFLHVKVRCSCHCKSNKATGANKRGGLPGSQYPCEQC